MVVSAKSSKSAFTDYMGNTITVLFYTLYSLSMSSTLVSVSDFSSCVFTVGEFQCYYVAHMLSALKYYA